MYCQYEAKKELEIRLNRIEGQVRGIHKMVDENRECVEILNQIASMQSALKGLWREIVRRHLQTCIKDAIKNDTESSALIDELVKHIDKIK